MDERFKIYVEQLRGGHVETLSESFSPEFLDVHEKDLKFIDPVFIKGEAYLAEDILVLHVDISTLAVIPCSICNEPVKVNIAIRGSYQAIPLEEVKGGIYNFQHVIREMILLETPVLAECGGGNCPQRNQLEKYLKQQSNAPAKSREEEGYRPFADLDIDSD